MSNRIVPIGRKFAASALLALMLGGCATLPAIDRGPELAKVGQFKASATLAAPAGEWPQDDWWHHYQDAQLDALIAEAIANSPTLEIAAARVRRAEAVIEGTRAEDLPHFNLGGSMGEAKMSYWNGMPYAAVPKGVNEVAAARIGMEWSLDFFGKNRAALASTISAAQAAKADAAQARLLLTTGVASAYAELLGQLREVDLAEQTVHVREGTVNLVKQRRSFGLETLASEAQAISALETARQAMESNKELAELTRLRLSALLGSGPDRAMAITRPANPTLARFGLPENLPAELLGRRPDVRAARLRVEASASQIKVARAGFYPSINLAGAIGPQSLGLDQFFNVASMAGNFGPAISLPLFRGGALRANLRVSHADYDAAVASYNDVLLHALQDVAMVAASQRAISPELVHAQAALDAAEMAYKTALIRYRGGLLTYISVLSAENTMISARRAVSQLETRRFTLDVALVRALGGGA